MRSRIPRHILAMMALLVPVACTSGPGPIDDRPYVEESLAVRTEKERWLRTDKDSPVPPRERAAFRLAYYDINPAFRVPAFLAEQRGGVPVIIEMRTTDGKTDRMRKVGALGFTLNAAKYTLTAFADVNDSSMNRLFVPFGDLTNTSATYGGGRYLNLQRTPTGVYDLDFNQAFHPYCVYNPEWVCPVPPRENRLMVAIPAGERLASPK